MGLQSIDISGFNSGVQKNKKPFLLTEDAFVDLQNAYVWRQELKKREGIKLIGRLKALEIQALPFGHLIFIPLYHHQLPLNLQLKYLPERFGYISILP